MRRDREFLTIVVATLCAALACGGRTPTPPTQPNPPAATCDATKAQFAVGQAASEDLLERARTAAGARSARFIRPNQPITMEFLGSRLNLNLNEREVVNGANCG
jgi:Peptidase inhibitor I78 family